MNWCEHIYKSESKWRLNLERKTSMELCEMAKFCPRCGTPRPSEPKSLAEHLKEIGNKWEETYHKKRSFSKVEVLAEASLDWVMERMPEILGKYRTNEYWIDAALKDIESTLRKKT